MSQKIKNAKQLITVDHIDRISDLPSNIIEDILKHLPIQDVVRTSILSRKWRHMWVSVPQLKFDNNFFEKCKRLGDPEIPNFITEVLLLHNGPVTKFTLAIPGNYTMNIRCLNHWILFLSRSGIEHLELLNRQTMPYQMPSYLFSCQELTYLELENFMLSLRHNFCGFKSLRELHLHKIRFEPGALDSLISGCPVLEALTISCCSGSESIIVSAPCLDVLYIIGGQVIKSICLKKAKNLTDVTLFTKPAKDFDRVSVSNFIEGLPKIERLYLGWCYIKILSAGIIPQRLHRSIDSLQYLELDGVNFNKSREILFIICLLKSSPNLVELVIESNSRANGGPVPEHLKELDCNSCCISRLLTVNITVKEGAYEHALDFIKFLLANSPSLKTLTFTVGFGPLNNNETLRLLSILQALLQMERASPRAQVKFLYSGLDLNNILNPQAR